MKYYRFIFICFILLAGCEDDPIKKVDVGHKSIPFAYYRLDTDVFGADYSNASAVRNELARKYGSFYCDFVELILQIGPCDSDSTAAQLRDFVNYPDIAMLEKEIIEVFPQAAIDEMNLKFEDGLKRWNYFFPDSIIPSVIYMNSGFNYSAYSADSVIAVGLDYFLGPDNKIVQQLAPELFPQYIKEDMKPEYVVCNSMKNFVWKKCERVDMTPGDPDLLTMLFHHGKMMYITDALVPFIADSVKLNWSPSQMAWAIENEKELWKELAREEIMFRTTFSENKKWFDFGPFTTAKNIPQNSPPQLGIWMGLNFVRSYMKANPEVTLQDLINERDYQKMLKSYKPYI